MRFLRSTMAVTASNCANKYPQEVCPQVRSCHKTCKIHMMMRRCIEMYTMGNWEVRQGVPAECPNVPTKTWSIIQRT